MISVKSAQILGSDVQVVLTDGTTDETLTFGQNVGENLATLKSRVKASLVEALAVRNATKAKTTLLVSDVT